MTKQVNLRDLSNYQKEFELYELGHKYIVGLDEVGRGCMAGPLVVSAVILDKDNLFPGINDSKKLSEKKREELYQEIIAKAIEVETVIMSVEEVDELNVYQASKEAMKRALAKFKTKYDYVLSDAMPLEVVGESLIKGDATSASIGAASIVAKVTRDHIMYELAKKYPEYGFEKHVGYCTKMHKEALHTYGVIDGVHRKTFGPVKEVLESYKVQTLF